MGKEVWRLMFFFIFALCLAGYLFYVGVQLSGKVLLDEGVEEAAPLEGEFYFTEPIEDVFGEPIPFEVVSTGELPAISGAFFKEENGLKLHIAGENLEDFIRIDLNGNLIDKGEKAYFDSGSGEIIAEVDGTIEDFAGTSSRVTVIGPNGDSNTFVISGEGLELGGEVLEPVIRLGESDESGFVGVDDARGGFDDLGDVVGPCVLGELKWEKDNVFLGEKAVLLAGGSGNCEEEIVEVSLEEVDFSINDPIGSVKLRFRNGVARLDINSKVFEDYFNILEGGSLEIRAFYTGSTSPVEESAVESRGIVTSGILNVFRESSEVESLQAGGSPEQGGNFGPGFFETGSSDGGGGVLASTLSNLRKGCGTIYGIDDDCDGYGVGYKTDSSGNLIEMELDPDDSDLNINSLASLNSKYGDLKQVANLKNYLSDKGYGSVGDIYFVDYFNGDDASGAANDFSKPFKSFDELICDGSCAGGNRQNMLLKPGDAVVFMSGDYVIKTLSPTEKYLSGSDNSPIVFTFFPGERPNILLAEIKGPSSGEISNLIFDGFFSALVGQSGYSEINLMGGNYRNIYFKNIFAHENTRGFDYGSGVYPGGKRSNLVFERVVVDKATPYSINIPGDKSLFAEGVTVRDSIFSRSGYSALVFEGVKNLVFENNIVHSSGISGVEFLNGVQYARVANNLIFNNNFAAVSLKESGISETRSDASSNNLFVNNVFWMGEKDNGFSTAGPVDPPSIRSSVLFAHLEQDSDFTSFLNNSFFGNIFIFYPDTAAIEFNSFGATPDKLSAEVSDLSLEKNIFYHEKEAFLGGGAVVDAAIMICGWTDSSHFASRPSSKYCNKNRYYFKTFKNKVKGNYVTDPAFFDTSLSYYNAPERFNFLPTQNSPRNTGDHSFAPKYDLRGLKRDSLPDIGAYESQYCSANEVRLCENQRGVCKGSKALCKNGKWLSCTVSDYKNHAPSTYEVSETKCDGLDNDCDGQVDEGLNCKSFSFEPFLSKQKDKIIFGYYENSTTVDATVKRTSGAGSSGNVKVSVSGDTKGLVISYPLGSYCNLDDLKTQCTLKINFTVPKDSVSVPAPLSTHNLNIDFFYGSNVKKSASYVLDTLKIAPEILGYEPKSIFNDADRKVTLVGRNFDYYVDNSINLKVSSKVVLDNKLADIFYINPKTIIINVPKGIPPGKKSIRVVNLDGKISNEVILDVIQPEPFDFDFTLSKSSDKVFYGPGSSWTEVLAYVSKKNIGPGGEVGYRPITTPGGVSLSVSPSKCVLSDSNKNCVFKFNFSVKDPTRRTIGLFNAPIALFSGSKEIKKTFSIDFQKNPPLIESVSPSVITSTNDQNLTVKGKNFDLSPPVVFNVSGVLFFSSMYYRKDVGEAKIPIPKTVGDGTYWVEAINSDAKRSQKVTFKIMRQNNAALKIIRALPNWVLDGGGWIVVEGVYPVMNGFELYIDGKKANTQVKVIDKARINVSFPSKIPLGEHEFFIKDSSGKSSNSLKFYVLKKDYPKINSYVPDSFSNDTGAEVLLYGENFSDSPKVLLLEKDGIKSYDALKVLPLSRSEIKINFSKGPERDYFLMVEDESGNKSNVVFVSSRKDYPRQSPSNDFDGDGIENSKDKCPKTRKRYKVNSVGCPLPKASKFSFMSDVSKSSLKGVLNFRLGLFKTGSILFLEPVDLFVMNSKFGMRETLNLDLGINIKKNEITLDPKILPVLNKKSKILFENTTYDNPILWRDGKICDLKSGCSRQFDKKTTNLEAIVPGYSKYNVSAGSCGDNYCNAIVEDKNSCPKDCSSGGDSSSGGGGGGGGGGSSDKKYINLDEKSSLKIRVGRGTLIYLTLDKKEYLIRVKSLSKTGVLLEIKSIGKSIEVSASGRTSINIDGDSSEDFWVSMEFSRGYYLKFEKIIKVVGRGEEEKNETSGEEKSSNEEGGINRRPEVPLGFSPSKYGFWVLVAGVVLVIALTIFLDRKFKPKPKGELSLEERMRILEEMRRKKELEMRGRQEALRPVPLRKAETMPSGAAADLGRRVVGFGGAKTVPMRTVNIESEAPERKPEEKPKAEEKSSLEDTSEEKKDTSLAMDYTHPINYSIPRKEDKEAKQSESEEFDPFS